VGRWDNLDGGGKKPDAGRGLNPFLSEVYLIKYNEKDKAQIVTGKDAFTRRAAETPEFRYFRAGVIVQRGDETTEREGTFFAKGEDLIGGWAVVYLEGREVPFKYTIRREEFDKKQANWLKMPGVMCRKCALVGALREALPEQLGGLYDSAEMRDSPDIIDIEGGVVEG
jgi:phage recombination protein Bet